MIRKTFPVGMLQCNCTILADEDTRQAVIIDPGDEAAKIVATLAEDDLTAVAIVHTHAHIDHIGGTFELAQATGAPTYLHDGDGFLHQSLETQAAMLRVPVPTHGPIDQPLTDDQTIIFGSHQLGVMHTPGHTPGSVCFELVGEDLCFSGDTLFNGSIGRTDLPGGDFDLITRSIRDRLYSLNGAVEVIPGHGPSTRIDRERRSNPFVQG